MTKLYRKWTRKEPAIATDPSSLNAGCRPWVNRHEEENAYQDKAINHCTMAGLTVSLESMLGYFLRRASLLCIRCLAGGQILEVLWFKLMLLIRSKSRANA
jgi:hypothetical protein